MTYTHEVAVIEHDTERTVKSIKVETEQRARKVERGIEMQLDHRHFYVEVRDILITESK